MPNNEWFATWFDSPYYPLLYAHRDEREALEFSQRLVHRIRLHYPANAKPARLLDLACGRGRYSAFFSYSGYDVTGVDLSPNSIAEAQAKYNEPSLLLKFLVRDIRDLGFEASFEVVANLFTSFGYFHTIDDNLAVLNQVWKALVSKGIFILDFFNAGYVLAQMVPDEVVERGAIRFRIRRENIGGRLIKSISIEDPDMPQAINYQESVSLFYPDQLVDMLNHAGFQLIEQFGNYLLEPFLADSSPRIILIAEKVN